MTKNHILLLTMMALAAIVQTAAAQTAVAQSSPASPTAQPTASVLPPRAGDTFWRDSIPEAMRQSYIRYGEQFLGKPWTILPWTLFAEYKTNGNRSRYEQACFQRRRQLAALAMAEIIEGKGRFTADIVDGLGTLCEETWWGIPAHYRQKTPLTEQQEVDLFNAETAGLVAWTRYMLQQQLDAFAPDICRRIDREIERRILRPAVTKDYWWKKAGMNWNPWICSNWLTCILISEHDAARRDKAISQIRQAAQAFIDAYPADGGCDEGPGYWDRAAASLFEVMRLLGDESPSQKVRNMAAYCYRTYIGNEYCVNFADAHDIKAAQQVNIVYPFGRYLDDRTMREFGAWMGRQKQVLTDPAALYDKSGNFPTLGRELYFLRSIADFMREEAREPLLDNVWLPDLQIMTARRGALFTAMKGGHNDESHNHNDVGSFIVYADGEPLLIDPGVGEYTAKTFGRERYSIWTMQSQYHNLPQINGTDQQAGRQYAAKVLNHRDGLLSLDIAGAYPTEAAVASWRRTVEAGRKAVSITDDYSLTEFRQPTRLMLMTTIEPDMTDAAKGTIRLGNHSLHFDSRQLEAAVDDVSSLLDPLLTRLWGPRMYRIVLTVKSRRLKDKIKYTIR